MGSTLTQREKADKVAGARLIFIIHLLYFLDMIIDVHTHIFPDKLAVKALDSLARNSGEYKPYTDATHCGLLASMDRAGIDCSWIASIATKPAQANAIREWSLTIKSPRIVPLGSVHPASPDFESEIESFKTSGFPGIKLHPLYQDFFVDDPALDPFYRALSKSGLFILMHAGHDVAYPGAENALPRRIRKLIERFPDLPLIAAHMGGWNVWEEVLRDLAGSSCYFDTSFIPHIPPHLRDRILERHTPDRFLFGSDSPWQDPMDHIQAIKELGLSAGDQQKIFSENTLKLLKQSGYTL